MPALGPQRFWCEALCLALSLPTSDLGYVTSQKNGADALGLQRVLGLASYEKTACGICSIGSLKVNPDVLLFRR